MRSYPAFDSAFSQRRDPRRGSVLIATLASFGIIALVLAATLSQGQVTATYAATGLRRKHSYYAAVAGLAVARTHIGLSAYNSSGNAWLRSVGKLMNSGNLTPTPPVRALVDAVRSGAPVAVASGTAGSMDFTLNGCRVRVYVYNLDNSQFQVVSIAESLSDGQVSAQSLMLRERSSFARYAIFREGPIHFGTTVTSGDVHSNSNIVFSGESFNSYGSFTSSQGFSYTDEANEENVSFLGFYNSAEPARQSPQVSSLEELRTGGVVDEDSEFMIVEEPGADNYWRATHDLVTVDSIDLMRFDHFSVEIQLSGEDSEGEAVTTPVLRFDLPSSGLIYTDRVVGGLEGQLEGRVTLVVDAGDVDSDAVVLSNPLVYVDSSGASPYGLYQLDAEGQILAEVLDLQQTGAGVSWDGSSGYIYDKNPDFMVGSATAVPPALGIVAKGRIRVSRSAPYNMVYHAAHISIESTWTANFEESDPRQGNWRQLGSKVERDGGSLEAGRYTTSHGSPYVGYGLSGEYIFDESLRSFPPPHFLQEEKPSFGAPYDVTYQS